MDVDHTVVGAGRGGMVSVGQKEGRGKPTQVDARYGRRAVKTWWWGGRGGRQAHPNRYPLPEGSYAERPKHRLRRRERWGWCLGRCRGERLLFRKVPLKKREEIKSGSQAHRCLTYKGKERVLNRRRCGPNLRCRFRRRQV